MNKLVMDDASMHKILEIKRNLKLSEIKPMMILEVLLDTFNLSMCQSANRSKKKSEESTMSIEPEIQI